LYCESIRTTEEEDMAKISVSTEINASKEKIWSIITNIEESVHTISGIHKVEILEKGTPFKGLKWRETREMFGKEATEVMWIHDCKENEYYNVRAENHGSKYYTDFYLTEKEGATVLTMEFSAEVESALAKFVNFIFGWMFKRATIKALQVDLDDIKKACE